MSDLASRIAELKNPRKGPPCQVSAMLVRLQKEDPKGHAALVEAIDTHSLAATGLADMLNELGYHVTVHSLRRHRKRGTSEGCLCS